MNRDITESQTNSYLDEPQRKIPSVKNQYSLTRLRAIRNKGMNDIFHNAPASIKNLPKKYLDVIEDWTDERNNGDGWWVYVKAPYWNPEAECRIIHEQQLSKCIKILKSVVERDCKKEKI